MKKKFTVLSLLHLVLIFLIAAVIQPLTAASAETGQTESENYYIYYDDALQLALTDVVSLMDLYVSIENLEGVLYGLRGDLREFIWEHGNHDGTRYAINAKRREIGEIERQIRHAGYQQDIIRISRESMLRNALSQIAATRRNIERTEANLVVMYESLGRTELLFELGRVSRQSLESARQSLQNTRNDLRGYELQLGTDMGNLNQMLGMHPTRNTVVVIPHFVSRAEDGASYDLPMYLEEECEEGTDGNLPSSTPVSDEGPSVEVAKGYSQRLEPGNIFPRMYGIMDFETHIKESIQNAPSIRQLEIALDRAEEHFRIEDVRVREIRRELPWLERPQLDRLTEELESRRVAKNRAWLLLEQAKASMENTLRQSWRNLENLMIQEAAAVSALEAAHLSLKNVLTEYGLGRNTSLDALRAEFAVLLARQRVEAVGMQIWLLEFMLLNP